MNLSNYSFSIPLSVAFSNFSRRDNKRKLSTTLFPLNFSFRCKKKFTACFAIFKLRGPRILTFIDKEEFLWRACTRTLHYRSSLRNIFVHLFCGTTTKRIIGVEAWRLVSMVKKGRDKKKKEKKRLERENKFAKSVFNQIETSKAILPFLILKIGNLFFFSTWDKNFFFLLFFFTPATG